MCPLYHGRLQVVSQPSYPAHPYMEKIRSEYVVRIEGNLRARKDPNKKIPSGMVELEADAVTILNVVTSKLPFLPAEDSTQVSEEVRLKHRVLDLRYCFMQCLAALSVLLSCPMHSGRSYGPLTDNHGVWRPLACSSSLWLPNPSPGAGGNRWPQTSSCGTRPSRQSATSWMPKTSWR